jgi:hypothetical protein
MLGHSGGTHLFEPPYELIADGLKAGEVVPFFGAAASAVYREPPDAAWVPGQPFTPFGGELATMLAKAASYTATDAACNAVLADLLDGLKTIAADVALAEIEAALAPIVRKHVGGPPGLALVASWTEHVQGNRRSVDRRLRQSFAVDCVPGLLHEKLAGIDGTRLYVTTNYDDLLEKALVKRHPHLLIDRSEKGLWVSVAGGALAPVPPTGTELYELLNNPKTQAPSAPIIFKMHGSIDRSDARNDQYLITEEDYVDFLGRTGGSYVPPYINALMEGKDFLFLGYSLEDWNVRVILRKLLKRASPGRVRCWAIVRGRSDIEQKVWQVHGLNIYPMDLRRFAEELARYL